MYLTLLLRLVDVLPLWLLLVVANAATCQYLDEAFYIPPKGVISNGFTFGVVWNLSTCSVLGNNNYMADWSVSLCEVEQVLLDCQSVVHNGTITNNWDCSDNMLPLSYPNFEYAAEVWNGQPALTCTFADKGLVNFIKVWLVCGTDTLTPINTTYGEGLPIVNTPSWSVNCPVNHKARLDMVFSSANLPASFCSTAAPPTPTPSTTTTAAVTSTTPGPTPPTSHATTPAPPTPSHTATTAAPHTATPSPRGEPSPTGTTGAHDVFYSAAAGLCFVIIATYAFLNQRKRRPAIVSGAFGLFLVASVGLSAMGYVVKAPYWYAGAAVGLVVNVAGVAVTQRWNRARLSEDGPLTHEDRPLLDSDTAVVVPAEQHSPATLNFVNVRRVLGLLRTDGRLQCRAMWQYLWSEATDMGTDLCAYFGFSVTSTDVIASGAEGDVVAGVIADAQDAGPDPRLGSTRLVAVKLQSGGLSEARLGALKRSMEALDGMDLSANELMLPIVIFRPSEDVVAIVMPRAECSLLDLIHNNDIAPTERRFSALSIVAAVTYMHEHGVVHGDIKPSNFLQMSQDAKGIVRLCDFGFALRASDLPVTVQRPRGSPMYAPPEFRQFGELMLDAATAVAADVYTVGVTLLQLFCGVASTAPWLATHLDTALMDIIAECVDSDARSRPSLADVQQKLECARLGAYFEACEVARQLQPADCRTAAEWMQHASRCNDLTLRFGSLCRAAHALQEHMDTTYRTCVRQLRDAANDIVGHQVLPEAVVWHFYNALALSAHSGLLTYRQTTTFHVAGALTSYIPSQSDDSNCVPNAIVNSMPRAVGGRVRRELMHNVLRWVHGLRSSLSSSVSRSGCVCISRLTSSEQAGLSEAVYGAVGLHVALRRLMALQEIRSAVASGTRLLVGLANFSIDAYTAGMVLSVSAMSGSFGHCMSLQGVQQWRDDSTGVEHDVWVLRDSYTRSFDEVHDIHPTCVRYDPVRLLTEPCEAELTADGARIEVYSLGLH